MKFIKKSLAILLAMLMLLAVSPVAAFAEGEENAEPETPEAVWYTSFNMEKGRGNFTEAAANVPTGGKISLLKDVESLNFGVIFMENATIEGNGFKIIRSTTYSGTLFTIENSATLTLKNVIIDGNTENYPGQTSSIVSITSGQLTLDAGAVLTNNSARNTDGAAIDAEAPTGKSALVLMNEGSEISNCVGKNGGAVYLGTNAKMFMNGGTIKDCKAAQNGGAVYLTDLTAAFEMTNGEITGCSCSLSDSSFGGSAVYVSGEGSVLFEGGKIYGNTNMADKGAVYVGEWAYVVLSGNAYIYDNEGSRTDGKNNQSNIFIDTQSGTNVMAIVQHSSGSSLKFGVSTPDGFDGNTIDISFLSYVGDIMGIAYNDADGTTFYTSNGITNLIECVKVTFDPGNGVCGLESMIYAVDLEYGFLPECDEREGFTFLGWYTANDVLVSTSSAVSSQDHTLYAKWENLNKLDDSPFAVIGRFFERIGELMRSVFQFLENLFMGKGADELDKLPEK